MLNLAALALVAFALALLVGGAAPDALSRKPRRLIPSALGGALLVLLLFFSSRFSLSLFGTLPIQLDLYQFAVGYMIPLAISVGAGASAVALLWLARRHARLAFTLTSLTALLLIGLILIESQQARAQAQTQAAEVHHPDLQAVRAPADFRVQVFARDLQEPNALAFDDQGNLYYTELVDGNVVRLRDANGDGVADERKVFASGFKNPRGLAWHEGTLYLSQRGQILTLRDTNGDAVADENKVILDKLFSLDIQHSNNGIAFGPDGRLYVAIGGPRVHQLELKDKTYWYEGQARDDWLFGGIIVASADGKNPRMFARGLRNPYALAFSADGQLFATDNGDDTIPMPDGDELNLVVPGGDYGYPYFFGVPPEWSGTQTPLVTFDPHSAPTGVAVYNGTAFPPGYRGSVFSALYWRGRANAWGREVVRVALGEKEGNPAWQVHDFVDGLDRPTALAVGPDGALYVADMRGGKADPDFAGAIFRISYVGQ